MGCIKTRRSEPPLSHLVYIYNNHHFRATLAHPPSSACWGQRTILETSGGRPDVSSLCSVSSCYLLLANVVNQNLSPPPRRRPLMILYWRKQIYHHFYRGAAGWGGEEPSAALGKRQVDAVYRPVNNGWYYKILTQIRRKIFCRTVNVKINRSAVQLPLTSFVTSNTKEQQEKINVTLVVTSLNWTKICLFVILVETKMLFENWIVIILIRSKLFSCFGI